MANEIIAAATALAAKYAATNQHIHLSRPCRVCMAVAATGAVWSIAGALVAGPIVAATGLVSAAICALIQRKKAHCGCQ